MHATRDAREPGDRGAGRHQRVHHRAQPRHEDHRGRRQVSAGKWDVITLTLSTFYLSRKENSKVKF